MTALTDAIDALSPTHYWKLDETSGSTAFDTGDGTTRDMTHINSPFLAVNGPTSADVGVAYNGTSQLTRLVMSSSADIGSSNTGTFLFFARLNAQTQRMVTMGNSASNGFTWDWWQDVDFAQSGSTLDAGGSSRSVETADINDVPPGEWVMLAFVHSGTVMTGWCGDSFIPAGNWALSGAGAPDGSAWIDFPGFTVNRFAFGALDRLAPIFGSVRISNVAYFDGVALSESQLESVYDVFIAGSAPINPPTPPLVNNAWASTLAAFGPEHWWPLDETSGDALDAGDTGGLDLIESSGGTDNRWRLAPGPIRGQPREYALWGSQSLSGGLIRTISGLPSTGFATGMFGAVIHVWSLDKLGYVIQQIYAGSIGDVLELTVELDGAFQMRVGDIGSDTLTARTAAGLAVDGTSYVVIGVQRGDGTGIRIYVNGVDVTDSNVAVGSADLDSFPDDLLTGLTGTTLSISNKDGVSTSFALLISNPFIFVNSVLNTAQILQLSDSALIAEEDLSDYFETIFFLSEQNNIFWMPGWNMNANGDMSAIQLDASEAQMLSANSFTGGSSLNNLEAGGVGKQIISEFNNYFSKFATSPGNSNIQATFIAATTVGTFNFVGRISSFDASGFNIIINYGEGRDVGTAFDNVYFYLAGNASGYKFAFRLQRQSPADFFQALSPDFIVPEPDAITMLTVVQDGVDIQFYIDGLAVSHDPTSSGSSFDETSWFAAVDAFTSITNMTIGGAASGFQSLSNFEPNEIHDLFLLDKALTLDEVATLWDAVNGVFPAVGPPPTPGEFGQKLLLTGSGPGPDHWWRMNDVITTLADLGIRPDRVVDPITGQTIAFGGDPTLEQPAPLPLDSTALSIAFDGTDDYFEVGVNGSQGGLIDNLSPSSTGSIGFFFQPSALKDSNVIYSQGDAAYDSFLQVGFNQNKFEVIIQRLANSRVTVTSGNSMSSTLFNFVVITCDGSSYALYLNGQQDQQINVAIIGTSAAGDWFRAISTALSALSAQARTGFTTETSGNVSEVFIYDPDILTPEEVKNLYDCAVLDGFLGEFPTEFHRTGISSASHTMVVFDSEGDQ